MDPHSYSCCSGDEASITVFFRIHGPQPNNTMWVNVSASDEIRSVGEARVNNFPYALADGQPSDYHNYVHRGGQFLIAFHDVQFLRWDNDTTNRYVRFNYVENDAHQLCIFDVACSREENSTEIQSVTKPVMKSNSVLIALSGQAIFELQRNSRDGEWDPESTDLSWPATVQYQCGLGRRFNGDKAQKYTFYRCDHSVRNLQHTHQLARVR